TCMPAVTRKKATSILLWSWRLRMGLIGLPCPWMRLSTFRDCSESAAPPWRNFKMSRSLARTTRSNTVPTGPTLPAGGGRTRRHAKLPSRTWHGGHLFLLIGSLGDSGRTTFIFRELLSAVALRCERQGREAERRGRPPAPWPQSAIPASTLRVER